MPSNVIGISGTKKYNLRKSAMPPVISRERIAFLAKKSNFFPVKFMYEIIFEVEFCSSVNDFVESEKLIKPCFER